jgi:hypothetical protein
MRAVFAPFLHRDRHEPRAFLDALRVWLGTAVSQQEWFYGPFRLPKKPELGPIIYWKRKVGTVTEKIGVENFRIGYDVRYFGFE